MNSSKEYYDLTSEFYDLEYGLGQADVIFFSRMARQTGSPVLEIGCGTGRISIPIAETGIEVWGLDNSRNMLRAFQQKLKKLNESLNIKIVEGDALDFKLDKKFNLIFFASNTFLHLDQESKLKALEIAANHLSDKGILVVDVFNPQVLGTKLDSMYYMNGYPIINNGRKFLVYAHSKHIPGEKKIIVDKKYYLAIEDGLVESLRTHFVINYITKGDLEQLAESASLKIVDIYGDYDFSSFSLKYSPRMIFLLSRLS